MDPIYRKALYSFRSKYRRKCKIEERKYKQQLCDDIYSNIKNDPKTFWNVINKIGNMSEKNDEDIQNKDDFIRYFENINNHSDKIPNSTFHNSIISHMNQIWRLTHLMNPSNPMKSLRLLKHLKTENQLLET